MRMNAWLKSILIGTLALAACSNDKTGSGGSGGISSTNDGGGGTGGSGGTRWMSAVGEGGAFDKTFDGVNWSFRQVTASNLYGVTCVGNYEGWSVGAAGAILHTSDSGRTWVAQASHLTTAL